MESGFSELSINFIGTLVHGAYVDEDVFARENEKCSKSHCIDLIGSMPDTIARNRAPESNKSRLCALTEGCGTPNTVMVRAKADGWMYTA